MMEVTLIGITKLTNPMQDFNDPDGEPSEQEFLASLCMSGCQVVTRFDDMITTPEQIKERIFNAVDWQHHTVLEFINFVFEVKKISRACSHQLVRHRMASFLQQSQRSINQAQIGTVVPPSIQANKEALKEYFDLNVHSNRVYTKFVELGIPLEDARFACLGGKETGVFMSINARSLMHLIKLRTDSHAQWEIQRMAWRMYDIVSEYCPQMFDLDLGSKWI